MIPGHPSEIELQRYALEEPGCTTEVIGHIEQCESCLTSISVYRLVSAGIKQQARPAFEFDVAELILAQLPVPNPAQLPAPVPSAAPAAARKGFFVIILVFGILTLIGLPIYFFRQELFRMLTNMLSVTIGLMAMTALLIIFFYGMEMYRQYRKQLNALDYQ